MGQEKIVFTFEEAKKFFTENSFTLPKNMEIQRFLRCIDDRATKEENGIAIPGAAGGIYMAVFDALKKINYDADPEKIFEVVYSMVGGAIHTDEKNAKIEGASPVAGCGHCNGISKKESLDPKYSAFIKNYFDKLQNEMQKPVIYAGSHNAKAVFVINDLRTGLTSKSGENQAYVYNKAYHEKLLREVGDALYSILNLAISKEEFNRNILESANSQLKETLDHLTQGLPFFDSSEFKNLK